MSSLEPKTPQGTLVDPFTGEEFQANSRNHYEVNDGIPVAPHVDIPRPTVRQRIENLIRRGEDPLRHYVGSEGLNMEVPDDPDLPITQSEANYLDTIASDLAEAAPLPDEGLPRPEGLRTPSAVQPSQQPPQAPQAGVSSPPPGPASGGPVPT